MLLQGVATTKHPSYYCTHIGHEGLPIPRFDPVNRCQQQRHTGERVFRDILDPVAVLDQFLGSERYPVRQCIPVVIYAGVGTGSVWTSLPTLLGCESAGFFCKAPSALTANGTNLWVKKA